MLRRRSDLVEIGQVLRHRDLASTYLRLRRALGHELVEAARLLPRFVAYLDDIDVTAITVDAALAWALQPNADRGTSLRARRMTISRGFARHMARIDPARRSRPWALSPTANAGVVRSSTRRPILTP
jgi:hypothetical protein